MSRGIQRERQPAMSEAVLQDAIIECAHTFGWLCAHFRAAQTANGWRTPVSADGKGFPDWVMVRRGRLIFAELKAARGKTSVEQDWWLSALHGTPAEVYLWTPRQWLDGDIERVLRGGIGLLAHGDCGAVAPT